MDVSLRIFALPRSLSSRIRTFNFAIFSNMISCCGCRLWLYRGIGHLISGTPHVALLADGAKVSVHTGRVEWKCSLRRVLCPLDCVSAFIPNRGGL